MAGPTGEEPVPGATSEPDIGLEEPDLRSGLYAEPEASDVNAKQATETGYSFKALDRLWIATEVAIADARVRLWEMKEDEIFDLCKAVQGLYV